MNKSSKKILFWAPRILCIMFAIFLSLFSFDVFDEGHGFWETILALLIHLVPVYVVVIVLVFAWRWEWVGAAIFFVLAVMYPIWGWGRFHWSAYVGISGPMLLLSFLFLLNWIYRAKLKQR